MDFQSVPKSVTLSDLECLERFLARDESVRMNRRAIAMMFIRPSVCLGRSCVVITSIWYALVQI